MNDEKEVAGNKQTYVEFLRSLKGSLERDQTRTNEIKAKDWLHPDVVGARPANSNVTVTDGATPNPSSSVDRKGTRKITFNDLYGRLKQEHGDEGCLSGHEAEPERE